jgi:hypothetical protein
MVGPFAAFMEPVVADQKEKGTACIVMGFSQWKLWPSGEPFWNYCGTALRLEVKLEGQ